MPTEPPSAQNEGSSADESADSGELRRVPVAFRPDFVAGAKAISPILPAGATVGLVTGVAATEAGLPPLQAIATSIIVSYPTVMLTAFGLLESETPLLVIALTALIVGVRSVMLSLSIAPYFGRLAMRWKWFLAYFLWTPVYALSIERFGAQPTTNRRGYWLGAAIPLWVTVQIALVAGVVLGASVPTAWQLQFVVPLAFIALLMRFLTDRGTKAAAIGAGVLAVLGSGMPLNSGIVVAAVGGTAAGIVIDSRGSV